MSKDLWQHAVSIFLEKPPQEVTKEERNRFKIAYFSVSARNDLLLTAAKNMIWMAERIHQAHHVGHVLPLGAGSALVAPSLNWKECVQGICGSMEHMLAQAGFTKDLVPTEVRP